MGLKKSILAQNPKVLTFGFTVKNVALWQKTTETPYFLVMKPILWIRYT
jgi:hypothetical protein